MSPEVSQQDVKRILGLVAAIGLGGCAGPVARDHDPIVTRRLDLVDEAGVVRARLGIDEDGSAGLFLLDADGRNKAALIDDASQTALYLFDGEGTIRVGVAQFAHGGGGVALHGAASKGATVLYMKDGVGALTLYDDEGNVVHVTPEAGAGDR